VSSAAFIPRIGARELLALDLSGLPIDRLVLQMMANARHVTEIQVVNGLTRGAVAKALAGETVGAIISAD
jgi:molybdenum storage protein